LDYPSQWYFSATGSLAELPLTYASIQRANWYFKPPAAEEPVIVTAGVYDKSPVKPLREWILSGYAQAGTSQTPTPQATDSAKKIPSSSIDTAFMQASKKRVGIVTETDTRQGALEIYEIGVVATYGILSFTRFITTSNGGYIYVVNINLPIGYPNATEYTEIYKRIVASFTITADAQ